MSTPGLNLKGMNDGDLLNLANDSMINTVGRDIESIRQDVAAMYGVDLSVSESDKGATSGAANINDNVVGQLPTVSTKPKKTVSPGIGNVSPVVDSTPMIPKAEQQSDVSFMADTAQASNIDHYDYTKIIGVPPIQKITAPVEEVDPTIPGTVKTDESGRLQKTFFAYDGLASDTILTYNHFVQDRIPFILASRSIKINDGVDSTGKQLFRIISFVNSMMSPPGIRSKEDFVKMYPLTALNTNSDYVGELYANAYVRNQDGVVIGEPVPVLIGSLPVMIRSVLCNTAELSDHELIRKGFDPVDPGGYFVMNGLEKIVLIQEKLRVNQITTYATDNAGHLVTKMTCSTVRGTSVVTLSYDEKTGVIKYKYGGIDPKTDVINALLPFRLLGELVNGGKPLSLDDIWNFIVPFIDPKDLRKVLRKLQGTFADLATTRDTKGAVTFLSEHRAMKTDTKWRKLKAQVEKDGSPLEDEIGDIKDEDAHESHVTAALIGSGIKKIIGNSKGTKRQLETAKLPKLDHKTKKDILQKDMLRVLFPQLDKDVNGTSKKLYMLGMMIAHFGQVLAGVRKPDDRDDWGNKQLKSPGLMMEQLFTSLWNSMINKLQDSANQQSSSSNVTNLIKNLDSALMTRTFFKSFTSTKWGLRRTDNANITDILKRASLAEVASYITKISTPADKNVKKPEIRMVQGSQLGYVCPIDTPEGGSCGLVKHKAITCHISIEHGEGLVRQELNNGRKLSLRKTTEYNTICLLNSVILGWCNGADTAEYLVRKRRNLSIYSDICVYHDARFHELSIFTNAGRPTRPLLVVDTSNVDHHRLVIDRDNLWGKSYEELLAAGAVEYLDALEQNQENIVVAMSLDDFRDSHQKVNDARTSFAEVEMFKALVDSSSNVQDILQTQFAQSMGNLAEINLDDIEEIRKYADNEVKLARAVLNNLIIQSQYTHCELDPTALMGISASLIPLSNHNQGPRNIYQASMGKQALGLVNGAISHRMENMKALAFPTRSYFATQSSTWLGMDEVPAAQTATVAFMSYTGYNQEDAILINEAALQRGAFRYTVYHTYKASNKTSNDLKELFERPTPRRGESPELYSALNENGIPQIGRKVKEDYYIIGRVRRTAQGDGTDKIANMSTALPAGIEGVVDRVLISIQNGVQTIKVRIRQTRIPVRGDKFASRHAQKSTVGLVVAEEDMPRTLDGRRPTIVINPLCIPSRMTLGMVLELLGSKAAVMLGERVNATAFRNFTQKTNMFQELQRTLQEYGFNKLGNETMVSGITGEKFTTPIFVGPVYYQLLKHLVQFKYHARGGTGAVSILTRQPVPGRTRGGGLRTGEMERDSLIGHGASALLKGKLCDQSDPFVSVYCQKCGIPARHAPQKPAKCPNCKSEEHVGTATTPYSYQLLAHLVRGVGFRPRFGMAPVK